MQVLLAKVKDENKIAQKGIRENKFSFKHIIAGGV